MRTWPASVMPAALSLNAIPASAICRSEVVYLVPVAMIGRCQPGVPGDAEAPQLVLAKQPVLLEVGSYRSYS